MQLYHSTDRDGTHVRPSVEAMQAVLEQLNEDNAAEADYPEVCLMNDTVGWSLLVYPSAIVTAANTCKALQTKLSTASSTCSTRALPTDALCTRFLSI